MNMTAALAEEVSSLIIGVMHDVRFLRDETAPRRMGRVQPADFDIQEF